MGNIKLDLKNVKAFEKNVMDYAEQVSEIHRKLHEKASDEKEFCGWIDLPTNYDRDEFERIKKAAKKIQSDSDILLVIGIGGSYLGARAVIESLTNTFYNLQDKKERKTPQILYVGNNLSTNYINDLIDYIGDKDIEIEDFNYYLIQISFQWEIINSLLIIGSVGTENENLVVGNLGLEYTAFDSFFIRAGIQTAPLLPSLGIGYNFSCFTIDVASIYHPILGMSTGLGLSFSF